MSTCPKVNFSQLEDHLKSAFPTPPPLAPLLSSPLAVLPLPLFPYHPRLPSPPPPPSNLPAPPPLQLSPLPNLLLHLFLLPSTSSSTSTPSSISCSYSHLW